MKIYKFYGKLNIEIQPPFSTWIEKWHHLPIIFFKNQQIEKYLNVKEDEYLIRMKDITIENFNSDFTNLKCVEILFDAETKRELVVRGVHCEEIRPEALCDAGNMNQSVYFELNTEKDEKKLNKQISKSEIQDVIDRMLLYGERFNSDLLELCNKYPLKVEYVKSEESDLVASMRKVSI